MQPLCDMATCLADCGTTGTLQVLFLQGAHDVTSCDAAHAETGHAVRRQLAADSDIVGLLRHPNACNSYAAQLS